jgi:pyridoxal biosynthesis lyase PdxS
MLTQIYEVATPAEAEAISAIGVDHVGVLVGDGAFPRELSVQKASAVMKMIRTSPTRLRCVSDGPGNVLHDQHASSASCGRWKQHPVHSVGSVAHIYPVLFQ